MKIQHGFVEIEGQMSDEQLKRIAKTLAKNAEKKTKEQIDAEVLQTLATDSKFELN